MADKKYIFKTLKHRTLKDYFGYVMKHDGKMEIWHSAIPTLQPRSATIPGMVKMYCAEALLLEQLNDYDLITVIVSKLKKKSTWKTIK